MKTRSRFSFDKRERSGLFFFLLLIALAQGGYHISGFFTRTERKYIVRGIGQTAPGEKDFPVAEEYMQQDTIYPFNPNYISDYKGYMLGMSVGEIDRLHGYRSKERYINTALEFREVTGIPDSLWHRLVPSLRFPAIKGKTGQSGEGDTRKGDKPLVITKKCLNKAGEEDFRMIAGIGDKLAARIVRYRELLRGFSVNEQLYEVYRLDSAVVNTALRYFEVIDPPVLEKLDVNSASLKALAALPYLSREEAEQVVSYRSKAGRIRFLGELSKIESFTPEKIDRIALYLTAE